MALTASEEALVRQLLDQQAAILSLAGNEATITSKLGATKVTLADLVAASSLADADLLLTRQGTTDKSVRADILAAYMGAELGALFAPIANPTFTGDPKAPTAAQFDNDTSLATTAFVQRALGNFRTETAVNTSTTLGAAAIGQLIVGGTGTYTTTLPLSNSVPAGSCIAFFGTTGIVTWVVQRQGSDILDNAGGATFITLGVGDTAMFESNGTGTWRLVYGSASLRNSRDFGKSFLTNGWQRLPSGLIIQWGNASVTAGTQTTVTFPVAFPTTVLAYGSSINVNSATASAFSNSHIVNTSQLRLSINTGTLSVGWYAIGY